MSLYKDLEDGLAYQLLSLTKTQGQYLRGIVFYGGSLSEDEREREQLRAGCPCILVQAQLVPPKKQTVGGDYRKNPRVALLLCEASRRGQAEQRRGSGIAGEPPGLYAMIDDVYDLVAAKVPVDGNGDAIDAEPWQIAGESELLNEKDLQIVMLTIQTSVKQTWTTVDRSQLHDLQEARGTSRIYEDDAMVYDGLEQIKNEWP